MYPDAVIVIESYSTSAFKYHHMNHIYNVPYKTFFYNGVCILFHKM